MKRCEIPFICNYLFSLWSQRRWKRLVRIQCWHLIALEHKSLLCMPRTTLHQNKIMGTSKLLCEQHSKCSLAWLCAIEAPRLHCPLPSSHFQLFRIPQTIRVALPSQIKKKSPTKYLFFLTSPHRTGKRLHKAHVPAHGWLVPVGWLTITWVSVSFALCKDSKLAHFSTLVPPVLMDHVGISCLWDLCLQSYLKRAKVSPKFKRGHHSSNLFSQQGQHEELFHCSVHGYSHNKVGKNCARIMWEIHEWAFTVDFYLQAHLQVDGKWRSSCIFRASRRAAEQPHGRSGCSCSPAILLLPICLEQIYF